MKEWCPSEEYNAENPSCWKYYFNTTNINPEAYACKEALEDSASFETKPLAHTDNQLWHHLVLTTKLAGKGMDMYIDGVLEAAHPYDCTSNGCVGLDKGNSDLEIYVNAAGAGGNPIFPEGNMRLCGRQKGGSVWNADYEIHEDEATFDDRRYFRGQVAHFAVWDSALSQRQVEALFEEYMLQYQMTGHDTQRPSPPAPPLPPAVLDSSDGAIPDWMAEATAAGWIPCGNKVAARKRKLALLEDQGAQTKTIQKMLMKLGYNKNTLTPKTEADKERQRTRRLSLKVASRVAADDDDEL